MSTRKLVVIDLSSADIEVFESYERQVLSLLSKYGGRLESCVRSIDGTTETHLLYFPDNKCFEGFVSDPKREALKGEFLRSGVSSTITDVVKVSYLQ
jgi:uncharacterized protein (DUF1330 family)